MLFLDKLKLWRSRKAVLNYLADYYLYSDQQKAQPLPTQSGTTVLPASTSTPLPVTTTTEPDLDLSRSVAELDAQMKAEERLREPAFVRNNARLDAIRRRV